MSRLLRIDEQLASLPKPKIQRFDASTVKSGDDLILCAGFEQRSVHALQLIKTTGVNVAVVDYLPAVTENRLNEVEAYCKQNAISLEVFAYDRRDPADGAATILERLSKSAGRVHVDISGMSRLLIVQLIVGLFQRRSGLSNIALVYTEALKYPPSEVEVQAALKKREVDTQKMAVLLSSGVFDVTIVPELSSTALEGQPVRLVAFPSFNPDQMSALRAEIQPARLSIINGVPPSLENGWRTGAISTLNDIAGIEGREELSTSTFDYRDTLNCILDIYERVGASERLVISPTGSKLQSVAVALARAYLNDVQIVYPTPREFRSSSYTEGVKACYQIPLDVFSSNLGHRT